MRLWIILILMTIIGIAPVRATYSRLNQLGISPGLVADRQADTYILNPSFGEAYEESELNIYSITQGSSTVQVPCFYTTGAFEPCPRFDSVASFLNVQYAHPFSRQGGFFLGLSPGLGFSRFQTPLFGILSGNVAAGGWYAFSDSFVAGINVTWRMANIATFGELDFTRPEFESRFSIQPGIRFRPGKVEIGYSVIFSDTLLSHISANYIISSLNTLSTSSEAPSFYMIHHLHFRFPLSETLEFYNGLSMQHNLLDYHARLASFVGIRKERILFLFGIEYYSKSGFALQDMGDPLQFTNNLVNVRGGMDIHLLDWLDLRFGILVFTHNYISFTNSALQEVFTFEFVPSLDGGLKFNFPGNSDLEINLQQQSLRISAVDPGVKIFFQYNSRFATGKKEEPGISREERPL